MALSNVPSLRELPTEEQIQKIQKYLMSLRNDLEYELANVSGSGSSASVDVDLSNLFEILGFTPEDVAFWNNIKYLTDNVGNIIAQKIAGLIDLAKTRIMSSTTTINIDEHGFFLTDKPTEAESTWAMRLGAAGFMIAKEKVMNADNETWTWNWTTFGTGEGFSADCITAGELHAITLNACDILAGNMTSGDITGVNMRACNLSAVQLISSTIESTEITAGAITGSEITGGTITGTEINGAVINAGEINTAVINAATFNTGTLNYSNFTAGTISTSTLNACTINTGVLNGNEINGGTITGAIVQSLGENGEGVCLRDLGYAVYAPTEPTVTTDATTGESLTLPGSGEVAGLMCYDQNGAGTAEEAKNRVFLGTENGYAFKIYSDADLSISAKGKIYIGDCVFMGTTNLTTTTGVETPNELKSIEYYTNGFVLNGTHTFIWKASGLLYKEGNRTIPIVSNSTTLSEV